MKHHVIDGQIVRAAVWIGTADIGDTAEVVTCRIARTVDGQFYQGAGVWNAAHADLAMTEYDATHFPGLYVYTGLTASKGSHISYYVEYYSATVAHPIDMSEVWEIDAIYDEVWQSDIEYIDTDGTEQTNAAWVLLSGIFSVLKREMKIYSP